ncbi:MAG: pro-sigmaK processing inhibitor BofA family protein [Clostridiaceae bacterium]|nr:pro-sigmaK processing inhibitor BofA family protein [Clostridiaceae bacterium]
MKYLLYAGVGLVALASLRLLMTPLRWGLKFLIHAVLGVLALLAFNFFGKFLGVTVGVNAVTALTVGILGPTGLLLLLVIRFIFLT